MSSEEIKNYIKQQLEVGVSRETIEKNLEENGWTPEDIQNAFTSFDAPEKLEENIQVNENETGEQKEIETGEIKNFKSFLKLCWSKERARELIVLGVILCFIPFLFLYFVGPFIIIIGAWWGIREKRKNIFLKSLPINVVPIFLFFIFLVIWYFSSFFLGANIFILSPILSLILVYLYTVRKSKTENFKYFLKPFWKIKKARYSIILGVIIFFVGYFISIPFLDTEKYHHFPGLVFYLFILPVIIVSSLFVVFGIWTAIKKVKKNIFLKFLFLLYIIIISLILFFWFFIILTDAKFLF